SLTLGLVTVPLRDTMTSAESSSMETTPASTLSTTDLACVLLSWSRSTLDWVLNLFFSSPVVPATIRSRSCWAVSWSSDMRLTPIWRAACTALARSSASFLPCQVRTPRTPVATTSATTSTPRTIVVIRGQPRLIGPTSLAQRSEHEPLPRSISQLTSTSAARHDVPLAVGPVDGTGRWIVSSEFHRVGRIRQVQVAVRELRARRGRRRLGLRARALAAARALGLGPAAVTGVGAALGEPGARGGARRDPGVGSDGVGREVARTAHRGGRVPRRLAAGAQARLLLAGVLRPAPLHVLVALGARGRGVDVQRQAEVLGPVAGGDGERARDRHRVQDEQRPQARLPRRDDLAGGGEVRQEDRQRGREL